MSDIAKDRKPSSTEKSNHSHRPDVDEKQRRTSQDSAEGAHSKLHAEAYKPAEKKTPKPEENNGGATEKRLQDAVTQVHDALHQKSWGGLGGPEPNVGKVLNMLDTLSERDQKRFEKLYNEKYKNEKRTFVGDLNAAFSDKNSADLQQIKNVLERPHNVADVAGQLQWATKGLTDGKHDKQAMEKVILDAVSMCTRKELEQLNMESSLKGNTNLSESARKALNLLFKGKDVIYDKDGHMKDSYVHVLSNLALSSHPPRLDLYKHALQSATTSCREAIKNQDGEHEIDRVFSAQDARIAKDYLNEGRVSLVTQIAEDHKDVLGIPVWNGKEDVARAMEEASRTADSAQYAKGEKLASQYKLGEYLVKQGNIPPNRPELQDAVKTYQALQQKGNANAEDRKAFKFYTELNHELHKVGNDREVKDWEAQLLGSESLISQLTKAHSDLSITSFPGHKRDDLYKAVENLSKKDWEEFRKHPEDITRVASTLGTFAEEDRARLTEMLREKVNANNKNWTYEQSKKVGHRSISEVGEQNKPNPIAETLQFHDTEKAANKIDAFMHLTDAERLAWRDKNSPVHKRIEDMTHSLKPGLEQDLAKRILDKVQNNKPFDAVDKVMLGDLTGEQNDVRKTVKDLEAAYKENPALLKDQQTKQYFEKVLHNAVDQSGLGTIISQGYVRASRYDEFAQPLFKTGHVPLDLKTQIATSKQQRLAAIKEATADELKKLQVDIPDAATKAFQDKVLGNAKEDRALLLEIARESAQKTSAQDKPESLANECRAFALGYGDKNPGELAKKIKGLSDAQKQVLANDYYRLYGKQIADDVIQHTPESQKRVTREAFSEFPVSSKQSVLNADANRAERREGRIDGTKQAADESVEALLKFVREHKTDIDKLPEKDRKQFLDAVENYKKAEKEYVEGGEKQAEALVNATITTLSLAAAFIPGMQPVTALRMAGMAATAGAFRTGALQLIQGKDFNGSTENILKNVFQGSTDAVLCFAGPEMLGMKIGSNAAKTALAVGLQEAGVAGAKFAPGLETALARQLDNVTCKEALTGSKTAREKVEQAFRDNALSSTSEKEVKEAADAYISQVKKQAALKVLQKEAKEAGVNVATGIVSSAGAQLATDIAFPPKEGLTPEQVFSNCANAALAGGAGGAVFHFGFKGLGAAYHGAKGTIGKVADAAGKDKYFASNGTVIEHADGTRTITGKDRTFFKPGDKIVPPTKSPEAQRPTKEAQDITHYMSDTGELRRTIPDGYTDVGPNQRMKGDGSISASHGATTYDVAHDAVFKQLKDQAKKYMAKCKHLPKDKQMEELVAWEKRQLGPHSEAQERAYTSFMTENGGKRIPVGELIDRGTLGCAERAHLLKLLADENIGSGYAKLVRGDGTGSKKSNHLWVETGEGKNTTIWDASREKHKLSHEQTKNTYTAESHLPEYGHTVKPDDLKPGEPVQGSPGWRYSKDQPKDAKFVSVVHDAHKSFSTHNKEYFEEFKKANPQLDKSGPKEGKTVKIPGPNGKLSDGYVIRKIDEKTGQVDLVKPDGLKLTVSKDRLYKHLPALHGSIGDNDAQMWVEEMKNDFRTTAHVLATEGGPANSIIKDSVKQHLLNEFHSTQPMTVEALQDLLDIAEKYKLSNANLHHAIIARLKQDLTNPANTADVVEKLQALSKSGTVESALSTALSAQKSSFRTTIDELTEHAQRIIQSVDPKNPQSIKDALSVVSFTNQVFNSTNAAGLKARLQNTKALLESDVIGNSESLKNTVLQRCISGGVKDMAAAVKAADTLISKLGPAVSTATKDSIKAKLGRIIVNSDNNLQQNLTANLNALSAHTAQSLNERFNQLAHTMDQVKHNKSLESQIIEAALNPKVSNLALKEVGNVANTSTNIMDIVRATSGMDDKTIRSIQTELDTRIAECLKTAHKNNLSDIRDMHANLGDTLAVLNKLSAYPAGDQRCPTIVQFCELHLKAPDSNINFHAVTNPDAHPDGLNAYLKWARESSETSVRSSAKGHVYEESLLRSCQNRLKALHDPNWVCVGSPKGSEADHLGMDIVFLNLKTKEMIGQDAASSAEVQANKEAQKKPWATYIEGEQKWDINNNKYYHFDDAKIDTYLDQILTVEGRKNPAHTPPPVWNLDLFKGTAELRDSLALPSFSAASKTVHAKMQTFYEMLEFKRDMYKSHWESHGLTGDVIDYLKKKAQDACSFAATMDNVLATFNKKLKDLDEKTIDTMTKRLDEESRLDTPIHSKYSLKRIRDDNGQIKIDDFNTETNNIEVHFDKNGNVFANLKGHRQGQREFTDGEERGWKTPPLEQLYPELAKRLRKKAGHDSKLLAQLWQNVLVKSLNSKPAKRK